MQQSWSQRKALGSRTKVMCVGPDLFGPFEVHIVDGRLVRDPGKQAWCGGGVDGDGGGGSVNGAYGWERGSIQHVQSCDVPQRVVNST
jgi:hypothetical protein